MIQYRGKFYMTRAEAAKKLGVTLTRVAMLIDEKRLPVKMIKVEKEFIPVDGIEGRIEWLKTRQQGRPGKPK